MALTRDSIDVRLAKAIVRAEFALKQKIARIKWEEKVLIPTVNKMLAGRPILGLKAGDTFDVEIVDDANHPPRKAKRRT